MKRTTVLLLTLIFTGYSYAQDIETISSAKPVQWSGAVGTSFTGQPTKSPQNTGSPFQYSVFGNFNLSLYESFDLPLSFNITQFGLNVEKPFYQFGISPRYKWLQVHLGHRNMFFNSYTLAGHTFWGAGIELNPGKFRFAAMTGRLREPLLIDALTGQELINPQFKRTGWGVKAGIGTAANFVDLILFRAEDDAGSIAAWQDSVYQNSISGVTGRFAPEENMILGLTARFTLFSRAILNIEGGGSFFTADQSSDEIAGNYGLFTPRTSSTFKYAAKTSLSFPIGPVSMNAAYERVQPDYFSHGTYNLVNDVENITVSPSGSFFKGRFSFSGMIGTSRNNLMNTRSETSKRLISSLNTMIAPKPHYGLNLSFSNFSFNQQAQAILLNDSVLIKQVNTSLTIMPYFNVVSDSGRQQNISAAYIRQQVDDLNPVTRDFGSLRTNMATANYSISLPKGFQLNVGLSHTVIEGALMRTALSGVQSGIGWSDASGLNMNLSSQISSSSIDKKSDGLVANTSLSAGTLLGKKHNLRANFNWLKTSSKQFKSYSELVLQLSYTYTIR